jgi:hypothetical protein
VAEVVKASVSKTDSPKGVVGSNPTSSSKSFWEVDQLVGPLTLTQRMHGSNPAFPSRFMRKPRWTIRSKTRDGRIVEATFHLRTHAAAAIKALNIFGIKARLVPKKY